MSNTDMYVVDLDSVWRNRVAYPNPADYTVDPTNIASWLKHTQRSICVEPCKPAPSYLSCIRLTSLILPYDPEVANAPKLYVDYQSTNKPIVQAISTIGNNLGDAKFVVTYQKTQYGSDGSPIWLHYCPVNTQMMEYSRDMPIHFAVYSRDGNVLTQYIDPDPTAPVDPTRQILATFEITPHFKQTKLDDTFACLSARC